LHLLPTGTSLGVLAAIEPLDEDADAVAAGAYLPDVLATFRLADGSSFVVDRRQG
jgi:hypothetical protein